MLWGFRRQETRFLSQEWSKKLSRIKIRWAFKTLRLKRFTVIVNEKTKPDGLKTLANLNKKDKVEGKYTVTDAGLYIALELVKK